MSGIQGRRGDWLSDDGGDAVPRCRQCEQRDALVSCKQCDLNLCKQCCTKLHAPASKRSHIVHSLRNDGGEVRLCALHDWEKLTLYSHRAKAYGCVKCFLEGSLKGHQGLTLQRAVLEVRETLQRNLTQLQQQAKELKELRSSNFDGANMVAKGKDGMQSVVREAVADLMSALKDRDYALSTESEHWHTDRVSACESLKELVLKSEEKVSQELSQMQALYDTQGDDELLLKVASSRIGSADDDARAHDDHVAMTGAASVIASVEQSLKIDTSVQVRQCTALGFENSSVPQRYSRDDIQRGHTHSVRRRDVKVVDSGGAGRRIPEMSDAMELERVAEIAQVGFDTKNVSANDRRLFWKHRVTLTDNKKALTKLLKWVQWDSEKAVRQLLELIPQWALLDVEDALGLLGESYMIAPIRELAIRSLAPVTNDELLYYLMPLTIALRYDLPDEPHLLNFLIERSVANSHIAIQFFWYMAVEKSVGGQLGKIYQEAVVRLLSELNRAGSEFEGTRICQALSRQESFVNAIHGLMAEAKKNLRETRPQHIQRLMSVLAEGGPYAHLTSLQTPVNLPHQPHITILGIIAEKCTILKSGYNPIKLVFEIAAGEQTAGGNGTHTVLVKSSNDLRRDQMISSCIELMDVLLQREGVDLKITTYKVTATSYDTGLVEWVDDCFPLSAVLADYDNDIRNFFRKYSTPDPDSSSGINSIVLDNFVKSCAGYCVISFLLGIGDRHLDNLMLSTNGRLFHVDFEYILGNDPKPFSPPMKLCEQMVVAMGGRGSRQYLEFQKYCCKAYLILRKYARLFISMFDLVADLDFSERPGMSNGSIIAERFQLELTREQAVQYIQGIIQESLGAIFPQVVDAVHRLRLFFKT